MSRALQASPVAPGIPGGYTSKHGAARAGDRGECSGELFVDDTCIECDTCRELAPDVFGSLESGQSFVQRQPWTASSWRRALHAVVSCPTSSIGAERSAKEAARDLPVHLEGEVYRCGYSSEASYGAQSYFLLRKGGNLLIDSPRFAAPLIRRIEELGGVRSMFLTHRDDVADHARFRERFGCERIIHRDDAVIEAEVLLDGDRAPGPGLRAIHLPGHTRGSCALLVDDKYLFTGDHLWAWRVAWRWGAAFPGTRGPSRRSPCASCSTTASSGFSPDTGAACTFPRPACGRRWKSWMRSPGRFPERRARRRGPAAARE